MTQEARDGIDQDECGGDARRPAGVRPAHHQEKRAQEDAASDADQTRKKSDADADQDGEGDRWTPEFRPPASRAKEEAHGRVKEDRADDHPVERNGNDQASADERGGHGPGGERPEQGPRKTAGPVKERERDRSHQDIE